MMPSNTTYTWFVPFAIAATILYHSFSHLRARHSPAVWPMGPAPSNSSINGPQNQTLGFGAIYVLAEDTNTWRVQGLLQAASLVDIEVNVVRQSKQSLQGMLSHFPNNTLVEEPSVLRQTLSYINLLQEFVASGRDSALIVGDDVDFGITIKEQAQILSTAISKDVDNGNAWDVLWLGQGGIDLTSEFDISYYSDPYALPWNELDLDLGEYLVFARDKQPGQGQGVQHILRGAAPRSTYAWAVTQSHARRLLAMLVQQRVQNIHQWLHGACKEHQQLCLITAPGIMHRHVVLASNSNENNLGWWRDQYKYTDNVRWSARCNAAGVGQWLGSRWQCLSADISPARAV